MLLHIISILRLENIDSQSIFYHIHSKNQYLRPIINSLLTRLSFCDKSFLLKNDPFTYICVEYGKSVFFLVKF